MRSWRGAEFDRIGRERSVTVDPGPFTNALPGPIDPGRRGRLLRLAGRLGIGHRAMASGAGHDSAVFGVSGVPTAMICVRNPHGSHDPHEAMAFEDLAHAPALLLAAVDDSRPDTDAPA